MGAGISIAGALLTIVLNVWWIPIFGYIGSAWATLACYAGMAIVSYGFGQKYYPVAYDIRRVSGYILLGVGLFQASQYATLYSVLAPWLLATELMLIYLLTIALFEIRLRR